MKYIWICLVFEHKGRLILSIDKVKIENNHFDMPEKFKSLHKETKFIYYTRDKTKINTLNHLIELLND